MLINVDFNDPVLKSSPSKQVALFVSAALRNAFASAKCLELADAVLIRETDFFSEEIVI